jgi:NtrC-family two-component system sensor histidine kinase KinB
VKTLQTKVLIGLLPTLAILVGLGLWAIVMFYRLGGNIDVILRENYTSILAAEGMKEAIERMDSGLLFAVGGRDTHGRDQFDTNRPKFEESLTTEKGNITVPGEQALVDSLEHLYRGYLVHAESFFSLTPERQTEVYFGELLPAFDKIRVKADEILVLNQENMTAMDRRARTNATNSIRLMTAALLAAVVLAVGAALHLSRSILRPIQAVTDGARAMARGELDHLPRRATSSAIWPTPSTRWRGPSANTARPVRRSCCERKKPRKPPLTRSPIPWWWWIRSARSNRPIEAPASFWAWRPRPIPPLHGSQRNLCSR